jgi:PAS domain-containing protein
LPKSALVALLMCAGGAATYGVHRGQPAFALYVALTTIFTGAAVATWRGAERVSTGVFTTTIALAACGAIFPLFIITYVLGVKIHYVAWNIPKLFLAFGMLLTIAERAAALAIQATERFRVSFEEGQEGILIFRPDTETILEANPYACTMYGRARDQLVGSRLKDITKDCESGERELRLEKL